MEKLTAGIYRLGSKISLYAEGTFESSDRIRCVGIRSEDDCQNLTWRYVNTKRAEVYVDPLERGVWRIRMELCSHNHTVRINIDAAETARIGFQRHANGRRPDLNSQRLINRVSTAHQPDTH